MGFKQLDITPLNVTPITPVTKNQVGVAFQVSRTDTVTSVKSMAPADASILRVTLFGSTASDAATTATVTVTIANNSGTVSTGTYNVKANGATTGDLNMTNLPNLEPLPLTGDLTVNAVYAETGGASTTGGPWRMLVTYVR